MMRALLQGKSVIPKRTKASAAVAHATRFDGRLAVEELPRLQAALMGAGAELKVDLKLSSPEGISQIEGRIDGLLPLQCLRCERVFEWPLALSLDLRLVSNEEEERRLLQDADPYWVQDDELPLHQLIEDEVLLDLPMLPRCAVCEAKVQQAPSPQEPGEAPVPERRESPFAALKGRFK